MQIVTDQREEPPEKGKNILLIFILIFNTDFLHQNIQCYIDNN